MNALAKLVARNRRSARTSVSVAPHVPTPHPVIQRMLELAELRRGETLYDLGCGDGRILVTAAQEFQARAVGVEIRRDLVSRSWSRVLELHLESMVKVIQGDLYETDLAEADVVTLYLSHEGNERLKPLLECGLKDGARIVTHDFEIFGRKPSRVEKFRENSRIIHTLFLYKHIR